MLQEAIEIDSSKLTDLDLALVQIETFLSQPALTNVESNLHLIEEKVVTILEQIKELNESGTFLHPGYQSLLFNTLNKYISRFDQDITEETKTEIEKFVKENEQDVADNDFSPRDMALLLDEFFGIQAERDEKGCGALRGLGIFMNLCSFSHRNANVFTALQLSENSPKDGFAFGQQITSPNGKKSSIEEATPIPIKEPIKEFSLGGKITLVTEDGFNQYPFKQTVTFRNKEYYTNMLLVQPKNPEQHSPGTIEQFSIMQAEIPNPENTPKDGHLFVLEYHLGESWDSKPELTNEDKRILDIDVVNGDLVAADLLNGNSESVDLTEDEETEDLTLSFNNTEVIIPIPKGLSIIRVNMMRKVPKVYTHRNFWPVIAFGANSAEQASVIDRISNIGSDGYLSFPEYLDLMEKVVKKQLGPEDIAGLRVIIETAYNNGQISAEYRELLETALFSSYGGMSVDDYDIMKQTMDRIRSDSPVNTKRPNLTKEQKESISSASKRKITQYQNSMNR